MASTASAHFDTVYYLIKDEVIKAMLSKKIGEVVIPIAAIPTYISELWLNMAIEQLKSDLFTEFGVTEVRYQPQDNNLNLAPSIIVG